MKSILALSTAAEPAQAPFPTILKKPFPGARAETSRKKLRELSPNLYCSVIGTCLTSDELRKIMQKCKGEHLRGLSDHDLHTEAVQTAAEGGEAGKLMHKALDRRHDAAIQRFDKAKSVHDLLALWNEAKRRGDIAGAYWAGLTHRKADQEFIRIAFGDVHMLSHLVASANRADIQRLAELETERTESALRLDELQVRLNEAMAARDETARKLETALFEKSAGAGVADAETADTIAILKKLGSELQDKLSTEIARRERAEAKLDPLQAELERMVTEIRSAQDREKELVAELDAADAQLRVSDESGADERNMLQRLNGTGILYVGGRVGQLREIEAFVAKAGGDFLHHDGGIENRRGLLAGLVSRADVVFFPVDCVSHDAVGALKRLCTQAGKPYFPLRTTSLTSFNAGLRCFDALAESR